jgi:hypothetical protein
MTARTNRMTRKARRAMSIFGLVTPGGAQRLARQLVECGLAEEVERGRWQAVGELA